MNIERFKIICFFIIFALLLITCFLLVKPFLFIIAWASILAVIAYPLHVRLQKRFLNPSYCALITLLLILAIVILPFVVISVYAVREGGVFITSLSANINELKLLNSVQLSRIPILGSVYIFFTEFARSYNLDFGDIFRSRLNDIGALLARQSISFLQNTVSSIVQFFIILITFYFLLRDFPQLLNILRSYTPLNNVQTESLIKRIGETIHATVYVAIIIAIVQGSLGGIAFWFLGLDSPLLWGLVMTVLCLVPFVGHAAVWGPAAVFLISQGMLLKAVTLICWGMFVIGLVDNFIRTFLMGEKVQLHPLLIFFSVLGGVLLVGPLGILFGPLVLVVTSFFIEILKLKFSEGRI